MDELHGTSILNPNFSRGTMTFQAGFFDPWTSIVRKGLQGGSGSGPPGGDSAIRPRRPPLPGRNGRSRGSVRERIQAHGRL